MRLMTATTGAALTALLVAAPAHHAAADKPSGGCPVGDWHVSVFDRDWQPGDPIDPSGQNLLAQIGVAGLVEEFGSLQAGIEAFGFTTLDDLYATVAQPDYLFRDHNGDGMLCVKLYPEQGGQPAFLANAVDNNAQSG